MSNTDKLKSNLKKYSSPEKAKASTRFFKTGPGQYGEGDKFIGVTLPEQRKIAKQFKDLPLKDLDILLKSPIHEERLVTLIILVNQFERADDKTKKEIYDFYLGHTDRINNWDLVDLSAGYIAGSYLYNKPKDILYKLARSKSLWERRISIIATSYFINNDKSKWTFEIAKILLNDEHDLINKAVGWMLREVGKKCSEKDLTDFLDKHATTMPRTALRYSIERFPEQKRQKYLKL